MTPTATWTPVPYPFVLTIEAFNEAGETVKIIADSAVSQDIDDFMMSVNGEEFDPLTGIYNPNEGPIMIEFPGVKLPGQITGNAAFTWDGLNDNGQDINMGVYYIKVSLRDLYGHVETRTNPIQVLRSDEYVRMNVFNAGGELIRSMEVPRPPQSIVDIGQVDPVLHIRNDGAPIVSINYGGMSPLTWDGTNSQGRLVTNGVYEIQLQSKTANGLEDISSKQVIILREQGSTVITDPSDPEAWPKIIPNPKIITGDGQDTITFQWFITGAEGKVLIRIYNMAGELVDRIEAPLLPNQCDWDLRTSGNHPVASGMFIVIMEGISDIGITEFVTRKFVIIKQYDVYNNTINVP